MRMDLPKAECNGICLYAADIGLPECGNVVAYAHPDCPEHGDPEPEPELCRGGNEDLRFVRWEDVVPGGEKMAEVQPVTYDDVQALLDRVWRAPYKDSLGRTTDHIEHASRYHGRQRAYVQSDGLPYNTHNWGHFLNRYGSMSDGPHKVSTYLVGVWKSTVEDMTVEAHRDVEARMALRLMGQQGW
jgi:hypothetical protein